MHVSTSKGAIPLSVELDHWQNPLCQCGKGIKLWAFSHVLQWTRFAIFSPLFAVSYVDQVIVGDFGKWQSGDIHHPAEIFEVERKKSR
jgi:hypothetical protein